MRKKNLKPIIISSLMALAMGVVSVGTTFALFTDKAETSISVKAGKVDIEDSIVIKSVSSLNPSDVDVDTKIVENSDNKAAKFQNGGSVAITTVNGVDSVDISKMTPGDKVVLEITEVNKSNVNIKTRFRPTHTHESVEDLYEALTITYVALDKNNNDISYKFMDWNLIEAPTTDEELIAKITVTIEFKDHDNGQILFGDDNKDNKYQDSDCSIVFTQEAVQGNASVMSLIEEMNNALASKAVANTTMKDALSDVSTIAETAAIESFGYVWNSETDRFSYPQEVTAGTEYKYFKVYKEMPATQSWSIYAYGWTTTNAVALNGVGFDAGNATGITSITYTDTGAAKTVIINSNSDQTALTIDAENDVVHHYGELKSLNIIAVAGESYHEFGSSSFVEITKGRVALEEGSSVKHIHINAKEDGNGQKTNEFDSIVIAYDESVELTEVNFSRDNVEIAPAGTLVVALQEGTEAASSEADLDYVWLTKQGIYEQIVVSDNADTKENVGETDVEWVNTSDKSDETKDAAQKIANNISDKATVDNVEYNVGVNEDRDIVLTSTNAQTEEEELAYTLETQNDGSVVLKDANGSEVDENVATGAEVISEAVEEQMDKEDAENGALIFDGGRGTASDPYLIDSYDAFLNVDAVTLNSNDARHYFYKVSKDIDFSAFDDEVEARDGWAHGFLYKDPNSYSIDLNKHTLTIGDYSVFGYAVNLEVYNGVLHYTGYDAFVSAACSQGMSSYSMDFHDLTLTGDVDTSDPHYGPLVAYAYGIYSGNAAMNATNIVNNLTINNRNSAGYTGGLFGYVQGTNVSSAIKNCTFNGTIVSPHVGGFINTCSYPNLGVTSEGNVLNGRLLGSSDARAFGLNGNIYGGAATLNALNNTVTLGENAALTVLAASTNLITLDENNQVILNKVEDKDVTDYRVAILFMVNIISNGTGGYPRYITLDLPQLSEESVATGIYEYPIIQEASDLSEGKTVVSNGSGCKIWIENGAYHVYMLDHVLSNNKATIYAYAYNNGTIVAYQSIGYSY